MAKKPTNTLKKTMVKIIVSTKSARTGAYTFKHVMKPIEEVNAFLAQVSK